jgi:hypothetical protein
MFQQTQLGEKLIHEEIYYLEESHNFVRDEASIDAFRGATEFLDRNLSGQMKLPRLYPILDTRRRNREASELRAPPKRS